MASPKVELRSVQVFLVLSEELSFSRTAERVGLTTSRVSQTIRALEQHLDGELFVRTSRRVALTSLGSRLRDDLAPHYTGIEEALAAAREHTGDVAGLLRIGTYHPANFGPSFLEMAREFEATHPRATVRRVDIGGQRNPLDILRDHDVDALAMRLPLNEPDLMIGPVLSSAPRVLAVAQDHPLAARPSVSYEDVADYAVHDCLMLPREVFDALVPPRTPSGRPVQRVHCDTFFDVIEMVAAGRLVHPTVKPFLDYVGHPNITCVPIDDLPPSMTALVWLASHQPTVLRAFADTIEHRDGQEDSS